MISSNDKAVTVLLNEIRMASEEKFIIVEGNSDSKLLDPFFEENVRILNPRMGINNKGVVINTVQEVLSRKTKRIFYRGKEVAGIIDADFNRIFGNIRNDLQNLFYTDTHDIDSMIFSTNAFRKVINFLYWHPEIVNIKKIREKCIEISSEFGFYLLSFYENRLHNLKEAFKPIEQFFDKNLIFNHKKAIKKLKLLCKNGIISRSDVINIKLSLIQRKHQNLDLYQLANGHDLIRVFIMLTLWDKMNLKKKRTNFKYKKLLIDYSNRREYLIKELEDILRISYEYDFFKNSNLYKQIITYQKTNGINFLC